MSLSTNSEKIAQLKTKINALPDAPSGSINITANGTYDVTKKVSAVVNVSTSSSGSTETIAGITDLGAFTFTCDSSNTNSAGTQYFEYYNSAAITLPDDFYQNPKYKVIIPFKARWDLGTSPWEVGILEFGAYEDNDNSDFYVNGLLKIGSDVYSITPASLAANGECDADFPLIVDIYSLGDGWGFNIYMLAGIFNNQFINNEGSVATNLTDEFMNVHPLLISYDELGGTT